jgi:iron complex transport system substrate-binding protein
VPTYVSPADCVAKDNSGSGDGIRREAFDMTLIHKEIRDLAQIFNVADRGEALVADLQQRETAAVKAVASARVQGMSAAFWYSSRDVKGDAFVAGRNGGAAYIMRTLGLRNVVQTDDEWPTISWEAIAAANPSILVLAQMDRRRFPADDIDVKREFLRADPVASQIEAVRQGRIVVLDAQAMNPTIRTIDGIEAVAQGIAGLTANP